MAGEEVDLFVLMSRLLKKWKMLMLVSFCGGVLAYSISFFLPKIYAAKASIFIAQDSVALSLMRGMPGAGGIGSSSGYFLMLVKSDRMLRDVLTQLDLKGLNRYAKDGRTMDQMMEKLRNDIEVDPTLDGGISITVRSHEAELAAKTANMVLDNLSSYVVTTSERKGDFIEGKMKETVTSLRQAEDELAAYQKRYKVAAIDEETKGIVREAGDLESQLTDVDAELVGIGSQLSNGGDLKSLVDLEVQKKSLEAKRTSLAQKLSEFGSKLSDLPSTAVGYARLARRVDMLTKTYALLDEQFEMARISQHGEDGDYKIIDRAYPKSKPVSPRKSINALIGAFLTFLVASSSVVFRADRSAKS